MKPELVSFKSVKHGEYLYAGIRILDDDRRRVLTWSNKGDPSTDPDMHWRIEHFGDYVGIKSVKHDEWLYAGNPMLERDRRHALTWKKAGDPKSDTDMRWIIKDFGDYVGIKSVRFNEYLFSGNRMLDGDRRHALTWGGSDGPESDKDLRWIKNSLTTVITAISWKHIGTLPAGQSTSDETEVGVVRMNSRKETNGSTFKASFEVSASVSHPAGATAAAKASTEMALSHAVETMGSTTLTHRMKSTKTFSSEKFNRKIWGLTVEGDGFAYVIPNYVRAQDDEPDLPDLSKLLW